MHLHPGSRLRGPVATWGLFPRPISPSRLPLSTCLLSLDRIRRKRHSTLHLIGIQSGYLPREKIATVFPLQGVLEEIEAHLRGRADDTHAAPGADDE
jgi:hypothetical protein